MNDRLIVALDVKTVDEARELVRRLGDQVHFYKIGMWLFFDRAVHALIDELIASGKKVFLDYKMYDIPETVRRGVASVAARGASIVTVHGDPEIIAAAVEGAANTELMVFAITVLTSQDNGSLRLMGYEKTVSELIELRAELAGRAGAHGLIASAADDLPVLRSRAGGVVRIATPGIRLPSDAVGDQKRVATPAAAIKQGADYLVVGRPITRAPDPAAAARAVLADMFAGAEPASCPATRS
ncbi:MAG: orotidine-5'-phosphate decarboxylase [Janthinobacterium lividum]